MEINISSIKSLGNKSSSHEQTSSTEESTWTMYFEEYFAHKNDDVQTQLLDPFSSGSSSAVSDAASSAAGKSSAAVAAGVLMSRRRLGYKKRNKSCSERVEDDLQDTACSPKRNRGSRSKGKREGIREIMGSMKEGRGIIT